MSDPDVRALIERQLDLIDQFAGDDTSFRLAALLTILEAHGKRQPAKDTFVQALGPAASQDIRERASRVIDATSTILGNLALLPNDQADQLLEDLIKPRLDPASTG